MFWHGAVCVARGRGDRIPLGFALCAEIIPHVRVPQAALKTNARIRRRLTRSTRPSFHYTWVYRLMATPESSPQVQAPPSRLDSAAAQQGAPLARAGSLASIKTRSESTSNDAGAYLTPDQPTQSLIDAARPAAEGSGGAPVQVGADVGASSPDLYEPTTPYAFGLQKGPSPAVGSDRFSSASSYQQLQARTHLGGGVCVMMRGDDVACALVNEQTTLYACTRAAPNTQQCT